ncbi:MAG: right-handed parallel beta-helix repeat-containing protein [Deltaproteobacteria bacterium]|nr:right-handed parallel beta-helix repeat-containing protein [Deltaproteobacteria bacterium]
MYSRLLSWQRPTLLISIVCALGLGCGGSSNPSDGGVSADSGTTASPSACPAPAQAPMDSAWPEVFVGVAGCSDEGDGSRATPFCGFGAAFDAIPAAPGVVTVLDGEYRLTDQLADGENRFRLSRPGSASAYFVIRADEGASPRIYGSVPVAGASFEAFGAAGVVRASVPGLSRRASGLWTASGRRIDHQSGDFGTRYHADVSALESGRWTLADDSGTGCPNDDVAGCMLYINPAADLDISSESFELSQAGLLSSTGSDYLVVRGLTIEFTQWTPIFVSGAEHVLIEDNELAHNAAYGGNNAYGLALWSVNSSLVRRNRVLDTRYWVSANSWGITFMVSGDAPDGDLWVCDNYLDDFQRAAIGSKGGASKLHAVGNEIHRANIGVEVTGSRCDGPRCDVRFRGGAWVVGENLMVDCNTAVDLAFLSADDEGFVDPSLVHNNVIVGAQFGVRVQNGDPLWTVRNNVFIDTQAFRLGGVDDASVLFGASLDSDYNFFAEGATHVLFNSFAERGRWTLSEAQSAFDTEANSLSGPSPLDAADGYAPPSGSPVLGAGDPSMYPDAPGPVNMGRVPY